MERNKRNAKRVSRSVNIQGYIKRKMTDAKVSHYILFPVVLSTVGKNNDFFYHVLSLCWNDKNLLKDLRCKELFRGLHLRDEVEIENLVKSAETGWFTSSKSSDLAKIGKIAGYFIRSFACSVALALDPTFIPEFYLPILDKDFSDCVTSLKNNKTIVPIIVNLEISPQSSFDASRFVCLTVDQVNNLANGEEMVVTRRVKCLTITPELHTWAWCLLNSPLLEDRKQLMDNGITLEGPSRNENENRHVRVCSQIQGRLPSSRSKKPSTKYPLHTYLK